MAVSYYVGFTPFGPATLDSDSARCGLDSTHSDKRVSVLKSSLEWKTPAGLIRIENALRMRDVHERGGRLPRRLPTFEMLCAAGSGWQYSMWSNLAYG